MGCQRELTRWWLCLCPPAPVVVKEVQPEAKAAPGEPRLSSSSLVDICHYHYHCYNLDAVELWRACCSCFPLGLVRAASGPVLPKGLAENYTLLSDEEVKGTRPSCHVIYIILYILYISRSPSDGLMGEGGPEAPLGG